MGYKYKMPKYKRQEYFKNKQDQKEKLETVMNEIFKIKKEIYTKFNFSKNANGSSYYIFLRSGEELRISNHQQKAYKNLYNFEIFRYQNLDNLKKEILKIVEKEGLKNE